MCVGKKDEDPGLDFVSSNTGVTRGSSLMSVTLFCDSLLQPLSRQSPVGIEECHFREVVSGKNYFQCNIQDFFKRPFRCNVKMFISSFMYYRYMRRKIQRNGTVHLFINKLLFGFREWTLYLCWSSQLLFWQIAVMAKQ